MRVFTYGSLMLPEIVSDILGMVPACEPAVLRGYQRYSIKGSIYPALIRVEGDKAIVSGILYGYLTARHMKKLLDYEGRLYRPTRVRVETSVGQCLNALVFVTRAACHYRLSQQPWELKTLNLGNQDRN